MPTDEAVKAVVVGVDGSCAALNAVRWAAAEAVDRDVPLRLVHVLAPGSPTQDEDSSALDTVLSRAAHAAMQARNSVCVQETTSVGWPGEVLVCESRRATLLCIGSRARQPGDRNLFGSTATVLAERAACPLAIIRSRADGTAQTNGVVAVELSDEAGNDEVVGVAMHEGRLRRATVRQIDRRVDSWVRRYPDVHVEIVAAGTGHHDDGCGAPSAEVGLAVVGPSDADKITSLTAPACHSILGYPNCSVLLVRHATPH